MSLYTIALDVMGGDNAPEAILQGALLATSPEGKLKLPAERVLLVGNQPVIEAFLQAPSQDGRAYLSRRSAGSPERSTAWTRLLPDGRGW
jgi:fatty acid/phospholipid biosynthesis enzyme